MVISNEFLFVDLCLGKLSKNGINILVIFHQETALEYRMLLDFLIRLTEYPQYEFPGFFMATFMIRSSELK